MSPTVALLIAAGVLAVADWFSIATHRPRLEALFKPLTLVALLAAAVIGDVDPRVRPYLIAALALGLAGDVALLRAAAERVDGAFLLGLGAFALGHVAYVAAFLRHGVRGLDLLAGGLVVLGIAGLALPAALRGVWRAGGRELTVVVGIYSLLLAAVGVLGAGTSAIATGVGAVLFVASDALLARRRFVGPFPGADLAVAVSYHAAQALILIGLLRSFS